jgi:peptidoglycan hydrolase-like protein with peptidoglycan-binding domain
LGGAGSGGGGSGGGGSGGGGGGGGGESESPTYTELPTVGQVIARGEELFGVNGLPVLLLYGNLTPWRSFMAGMSPGPDVAELNGNLQALGYGADLGGDKFTGATQSAVKRLQSAHGLSPSGELPLGSVLFQPAAVQVTTVTPEVGATVTPGSAVLQVTLTARQVQVALDASEQSEVRVGDKVSIVMPDNSTTPGVVSYVSTVATNPSSSSSSGSGPTVTVNITPTDPAATGNLDDLSVNVWITIASVANAYVVPVDALLALASGGYALEVVGAHGVHHLLAVTLGLFDDADGEVQVIGAVHAGEQIVVPAV